MLLELSSYHIVWLQATPAIAALYYHTHLVKTHALYCPDDLTSSHEPIHTRALARNILKVLDSNDRHVALHFMQPCPETKSQDLLRFLYRSRPTLKVRNLIIPSTAIQASVTHGWATGLLTACPNNDTVALWHRRCAIPYDSSYVTPLPVNDIHGKLQRPMECSTYSDNFILSHHAFTKKALFVKLHDGMVSSFSLADGLLFQPAFLHVIQGWIDAAIQLDNANTLIFMIDERTLFGHIPKFQRLSKQQQKETLEQYRSELHAYIQILASEVPIYLYCLDYSHETMAPLEEMLA
ncbi:uncharacterized protein BYT42DRAFT_229251 [Radiomyces spectabilis]|uniref:uncharacterized protein n=1 Tax=Radiomyces spectabilis TaxID=64574 RepID=UPI002220CF39|nr:uncharacterized protein BYT42DRAFT_229251 [Radiomyces spectabilis]KAI8388283.1 hypothetical protein BYT42DRAFT_229251 [Radiomyces spectabilis]